MWDALFWAYLVNATLLIVHEIDSAYWKEWELFRLPGGIGFFLLLHVPLVGLILWGLAELMLQSTAGLIMSLVLVAGGLFAFCAHMIFIKLGREQFKTPASIILLVATLLASLTQLGLLAYGWLSPAV